MSDRFDAIVVGAGPNGLVAANRLADAGWSVLVLEAQPTVGGAVRSDRDVDPEFVHDTFSSFYPLAAASPAIRSFDLEQHGLTWVHAPAVLGHPLPDGDWALLHRDRDRTASMLEGHQPGDGEAWLRLCAQWDVIGPSIVGALLSPFPPVRHGLGGLARVRRAGGLDLVRTLLTPANELGRSRFTGAAPRLLLAGNAGHADIPLDAPGVGPDGAADVDARADRRVPGARGRRGDADRGAGPAAGGPRRGDPHRHRGRRDRGRPGPGDRRTHRRREQVRRPPGRGGRRDRADALPHACWTPTTSRPPPPGRWTRSSSTPAPSRSTGPSTARCRGAGPRWSPPARCTWPTRSRR